MLICRATGLLMIVLSCMICILIFMNRHVASRGGRDLSPGWVVALVLFLLGIGVFMRYKPAVVAFMVASSSYAIWLTVASLLPPVDSGFVLLNVLHAGVVVSPSIYFYVNWSTLFD